MPDSEAYKLEIARIEMEAFQCRQKKRLQVVIMGTISVIALLISGTTLQILGQSVAAEQLFATVTYVIVGGGGYSAGWFTRRRVPPED